MSVSSPDSNGREYKLHRETETFHSVLTENGSSGHSGQTVEELRKASQHLSDQFGGDVFFDGKIKEYRVPSVAGGIPVTVYTPKEVGPKPSVFVYFNGGEFLSNPTKGAESVCKLFARETPCVTVNVRYRLAPENKFPCCHEDAISAVRWVTMNKALLGASNDSTVGVGGFSAGANIAANVCHEVQGIKYQILVCPKLQMGSDLKSYSEFEEDCVLTKEYLERVRELFVENEEDLLNVRCNPLNRASFDKLPATLILAAECDPVRDDAYEYSKKLKDAKVRTRLIGIKGACHVFFGLPGHFKDCSEKAYLRAIDFIKNYSGYTNLTLLT